MTDKEMLEEGSLHADAYACWEAMFDAAPEMAVDMEPFGYAKRCGNKRIDSWEYQISDAHEPVYSAEQLATARGEAEVLQAENEQLRKEVEYWKELSKDRT